MGENEDIKVVECKYKHYRHPWKYFLVELFILLMLCIINYTSIVLAFNYEEYERVDGFAVEQGSDVLFGVLPRTQWGYTYKGETYYKNSLMIVGWCFWDDYDKHIDIYVNKKVPDDSLLYFDIRHSLVNYIGLGLILFCCFQMILGRIINHKIHVFRKNERERIREQKEIKKQNLSQKIKQQKANRIEQKSKAKADRIEQKSNC